ncbi:SusD/RagB family nutrient-binding outer membrane lipoprotein [Halosquirtibacter xylanolyticus]|uniref:SusD/RagB family nutrient-binding outer membrane lipoprotein n=1 Tax=Halosquirtibacter xylanolyticus TaxID=3374599 RepID=UPI00374929A5|nr:SusD/RagB family nutrient-binding outer membrane lipoprotein [Prolixibacteraceae bacterium]
MKNNIISSLLAILVLMNISCSREEFAKTNTDPSNVSKPEMSFLFTEALYRMGGPDSYTEWFYNNSQYFFPWCQSTVSGGGNDFNMNRMSSAGSVNFYRYILGPLEDMRYNIDTQLGQTEANGYQYLRAITYPIQIFEVLKQTDTKGAYSYKEAGKARYTNPPLLTPKYDLQEELLDQMLSELNQSLEVLTNDVRVNNEVVDQTSIGSQDFVYGSDWSKWAKFTNSLRLKIAVRLLHQNRAKAIQIAESVVNHPAGFMTTLSDDFNYYPSSKMYHMNNNVDFGNGGKNLVDFLVANKDPRVRFYFHKNDFNSKVIQAFFDQEKDLPPYILANVDYDEDAEGNRTFRGWKGAGEPWVRYYGAPVDPEASNTPATNDIYFNTVNFELKAANGAAVGYNPLARYSYKIVKPNRDYRYPDAPGAPVKDMKDDKPYAWTIMSSAEVNLYLAEFKLLGANISGTAQEYLRKAVTTSIKQADFIAGNNGMPYYSETHDTYVNRAGIEVSESKVALKDGEITTLLAQPDYMLTGDVATDLEKVYIQMYIHFLSAPNELYVTCRRTGIPKIGSTILTSEPMTVPAGKLPFPRRFTVNTPTKDNLNYANQLKAIQDQNFTAGENEPTVLNSERLWYDIGAPAFNAGPNY